MPADDIIKMMRDVEYAEAKTYQKTNQELLTFDFNNEFIKVLSMDAAIKIKKTLNLLIRDGRHEDIGKITKFVGDILKSASNE